jgi:ATP-dependent Lon protease
LNRPTATEHQIASRIAKTIDPLKNDTIDDPLVRIRLNKESNSYRNLIIHYTHEARLRNYKKHIHQLWNQFFADTPVTNTKLIVGNRNSRNAIKTFIRRRPRTMLLARKPQNMTLN